MKRHREATPGHHQLSRLDTRRMRGGRAARPAGRADVGTRAACLRCLCCRGPCERAVRGARVRRCGAFPPRPEPVCAHAGWSQPLWAPESRRRSAGCVGFLEPVVLSHVAYASVARVAPVTAPALTRLFRAGDVYRGSVRIGAGRWGGPVRVLLWMAS